MLASTTRGLAACALVLGACGCSSRPENPQHVVLIVIDTLRADHLSSYGHVLRSSPTIDKLGNVGVTFRNAISQCSWTAPSMISMLTSSYLSGYHLQVPGGAPTIAEIFQEHGYETGAFVENPLISRENGYRGFDEFRTRAPLDLQAIEWIEENAGNNVFTYIHIVDPHDPYEPADNMRFPTPAPLREGRVGVYARAARDYSIEDPERSAQDIRESIGDYDAEVRTADARVMRYLKALGSSGQRERSIVVIASDHGEGLWTRPAFGPNVEKALARSKKPDLKDVFKSGHGNQLYREQVHVPLIIKAPGLKPGSTIDDVVENVDIAPTLLDLCGLPAVPQFAGESLVPVVEGTEKRKGAYSQTRFAWMWQTADGRKLIWPTELGRAEMRLTAEFYDLDQDPDERENLATTRGAEVQGLRAEIESVLERAFVTDADAASAALDANADALEALGYMDDGGPLDGVDEEQ